MLAAAIAQLLLHYACRMGALALCLKHPGQAAALAALRHERDAAVAALRVSIRVQRRKAMAAARARRRQRYRAAAHIIRPPLRPSAPQAAGRTARSFRRRRLEAYPA